MEKDENVGHDENTTIATKTLRPEVIADNSGHYILIPLAVLFGILVLSALVYLMARNRRRLAHIYCKRKYNSSRFKYDDDHNDDDSDVALLQGDELDDPTKCLLKGKLQIDNRSKYQTTEVVQNNIPDEHINEFFT